MTPKSLDEIPQWYVIHTHPKQEDRAEHNLRAWQIESFTPRCRQRRYNQFTGQPTYVTKPLFPQYIFARLNNSHLLKIRFTRGVHSIVSCGDIPVTVDDELIQTIKSREDADGYVRLVEELESGDGVVVKSGPFRGITGVFERRLKDAERVMILLHAVSYQSHIIVEREIIQKLTP